MYHIYVNNSQYTKYFLYHTGSVYSLTIFIYIMYHLKEKNTTWSNTMLDCERSVSRTLFMDQNSDRSH